MKYVLDGYNAAFGMGFYEPVPKGLAKARDTLINYAGGYTAKSSKQIEIIIVFDGSGALGLPNTARPFEKVRVVFTQGISADTWIKNFAAKQANKSLVTVVTDDRKDIVYYVRAMGCGVMSVDAFRKRADKGSAKINSRQKEYEQEFKIKPEQALAVTKELFKKYLGENKKN